MADAFGSRFAEFADGVLQRARSRLTGRFDDVEGIGEAADGGVRAVVAAGGRLRGLTVDPRLIRSRAPELLVEEIKAAVKPGRRRRTGQASRGQRCGVVRPG